MTASLLLTQLELIEITGHRRPADQLRKLHRAGFWLARQTPMGVALDRAHYTAVCAGATQAVQHPTYTQVRPQVRTLAMRRGA